MIAVSLIVLMTGLVSGVFAMLYGTERSVRSPIAKKPHERTSEHNPTTEPSPWFNLATVAAFSVSFGLTAYIVARNTTWSTIWQLLLAIIAGLLAMALQSLLIARWALPGARAEHLDERYVLQGTLARITATVPPHGQGLMRYALDGQEFELLAEDIGGAELALGVDVVIDRVEHGVAYVESWAHVEARL